MKVYLYPYRIDSNGAAALAKALDCKRIHPDGKYRGSINNLVINWGMTKTPIWADSQQRVLNHWTNIATSVNKLKSLTILNEAKVSVPPFTTDKKVATEWIKEGYVVVCRTMLRAHSGNGIVIALKANQIVDAPLYTQYVNGKLEFRVHVWTNPETNESIVFDAAQKKKKNGWKEKNPESSAYVRSHDNGYVFARENVVLPEDAKKQAIKAIKALGLNFAAVDIRYIEKTKKAYVLECNTSAGIEGQTLDNYVKIFKDYLATQEKAAIKPIEKIEVAPVVEKIKVEPVKIEKVEPTRIVVPPINHSKIVMVKPSKPSFRNRVFKFLKRKA